MRSAALAALLAAPLVAAEPPVKWRKTVLDDKFRSEGAAVADVDRDGKPDVLVGEFWYQAPDWTRHEMQKPGDYGDGLNNYSKVFACWADDLDADGFPDLLVVGFPGEPAYWLENPKGRGTQPDGSPTHWKRHPVNRSACNESPQYEDLFGTGKRVLVCGTPADGAGPDDNRGRMAYFVPDPADPYKPWVMHPISDPSAGGPAPGTQRFSHGLGVTDIDGDGKNDVVCADGWWRQPADPDGAEFWAFHLADLGPAAADMFAADVDGDGKNDVLSTSAHKYGIWWHKQRAGGFERKDLFPRLVSETHAVRFADVDGDGLADLVTGKRKYSHGLSEPGADKPAALYWLKAARAPDGLVTFAPHLIDDDSGVGTQFPIADLNGDGRPDLATANKKGVRVLVQVAE